MHLLDTLPFQAPAQLPTAPFTPGQQAAGAAPRRAPAAGPPPPPAPRRAAPPGLPSPGPLRVPPLRPAPATPPRGPNRGTRASAAQAWGLHGRRDPSLGPAGLGLAWPACLARPFLCPRREKSLLGGHSGRAPQGCEAWPGLPPSFSTARRCAKGTLGRPPPLRQ